MEAFDQHLLGIEGLSAGQILFLLDTAEQFCEINERSVKKVPSLRGKTVITLFYEASTRTRVSFELAAKRLSADTVNISAQGSSVAKGETLIDTALTLHSMAPDIIVMRHPASGAHNVIAPYLKNAALINAGDGLHEHPTQALLDALTIKQSLGRIHPLTLTMIGDSLRSRVARSNIHLHLALGNKVRLVAPPTIALKEFSELGAEIYYDLPRAIEGADVVMTLRMKLEYLNEAFVPSAEEYARQYCLSKRAVERYAPEAVVLAPGPVMRGLEMDSELLASARCQVSNQVTNGVAVRMGVLYLLTQALERKRFSTENAGETDLHGLPGFSSSIAEA